MLAIVLWSLFGYLCGSIPFAVIIGRYFVKVDPRTVGDRNPGGANVWKSGGWMIGLVTSLIEIFKGFAPVYLAQRAGLSAWSLVPVGLSPILGHATQPFLGWRGGKALGTTGGAWIAFIGLWVFPIFGLGAVPVLAIQTVDAYSAVAGMIALVVYAEIHGVTWLIVFSLLNTVLIVWTHRRDLVRGWHWRDWITGLFVRREA